MQSDGSCGKSSFGVFLCTIIASQMSADGMTVGEIQRHGNMTYNNPLSVTINVRSTKKKPKNESETRRNKSISG